MISSHTPLEKALDLAVAEAAAKGAEGLTGDSMIAINEGASSVTEFMSGELPKCPTCDKPCPLVGVSSSGEMYEKILKNYMFFALMLSVTAARIPELLDGFVLAAKAVLEKRREEREATNDNF